ncbi:MAG: IgGFc-binding protein, partial [Deltaproteobacteria bacterium]|nr:IgGFc-binding protein [Deltaproteobacteria bacterium]
MTRPHFPTTQRLPDAVAILITAISALTLAACANTNTEGQVCAPGSVHCNGTTALLCTGDGSGYRVLEDCEKKGQICTDLGCRVCYHDQAQCFGEKLLRCKSDGSGFLAKAELICDVAKGDVCNKGGCINACKLAASNRSYVGCEYWPVDLDNAVVSSGNAAAQQFAVVLSNPSPLPATVKVWIDEAAVGETSKPTLVTERHVKPEALEVLLLPSREVDGSKPHEFNTGTGTALTRQAYKITSSVPLIAYQFNPLANAGVFSNDASLLIPTTALTVDPTHESGASYLVMGWPQTIASTDDPLTNFGEDLRAFLTIVGTRDNTKVTVALSTAIIGDGKGISPKKSGDVLEFTINAFEVINLETGGFGKDADFTGTQISPDKPVVVYSGSEASDVPDTEDLTTRRCCADHLEQQLFPTSTLGRTFIALTTPSRSFALGNAGASIKPNLHEKEYFRLMSAGEFTGVTTNLPAPQDQLTIARGEFVRLDVDRDFLIQSTEPLVVGQFVAAQQEAGIPSSLPGGDPSFILLPPIEQFRSDYLFLTPDKYAFDFILVAAPKNASVRLDGRVLTNGCDSKAGKKLCCTVTTVGRIKKPQDPLGTEYQAYKCQLSFPQVIPGQTPPKNLEPGSQNDGVHRLKSTLPVGLVVYGF